MIDDTCAMIHDPLHLPRLRNAYCWQDAGTLLAGLDIKPGDTCLTVASAGDNALAMLLQDPARVIAVESNQAQIAALELRLAAFRHLDYEDMLVLLGFQPGLHRLELFHRCHSAMSRASRAWWDSRLGSLARGLHTLGIWENYYTLFRTRVLPLLHSPGAPRDLFIRRSRADREAFFDHHWDSRWRHLVLRIFFSRTMITGFDPARTFLNEDTVDIATFALAKIRHGMVELDPTDNPYLRWMITGSFGPLLPVTFRRENFAHIRANLDRLEWRCMSLGDLLQELGVDAVDRFNLGIQVEHLRQNSYRALLDRLLRVGRPGGRIIHWNLLVPRSRPNEVDAWLVPLTDLSQRLTATDLSFFHHSVVVEEISKPTSGARRP